MISKMELNRLRKIRHVVLDMDGTIYSGSKLFDFTPDFFGILEKLGIQYTYLTNNSSKSVEQYLEKLKCLELEASLDQIYTSALGTIDYLKEKLPAIKNIFVLGTRGLKKEFRSAGFNVVDDFDDSVEPEAVIVGFDTELTFERLSRAGYWIKSGKMFIATHPDLICPTDLPTLLIDCGSICAALEKASGHAPDMVLGKPDPSMIEGIMHRNNLKKDEVAMVGDRIYTDIEMAQRAGILGVLVLSGEATEEDVKKASTRPDLVVENILKLGKMLEKSRTL